MTPDMSGWTWRGGALVREVAPESRPGGAARPLVFGALVAATLVAVAVFLFVQAGAAAAPDRDWAALVWGAIPAWILVCLGVLGCVGAVVALIAARVRQRRQGWLLAQPDPIITLDADGMRVVALAERGGHERANLFVPWASVAEVVGGPGERLGLHLTPGGSVFDAGTGQGVITPVDRLRTGGAALDAAVIATVLADPHRRRNLLTPEALDRVRQAAELAGVPVTDHAALDAQRSS